MVVLLSNERPHHQEQDRHLSRPIFGDATIVSKTGLLLTVQHLSRGDRALDRRTMRAYATVIESGELHGDADSFVAVRRTGSLNHNGRHSELVERARLRAHEIAALLGLVFLAKSTLGVTCGLIEQVHDRQRADVTGVSLADKRFYMSLGGGHTSLGVGPGYDSMALSRREIKRMLLRRPFGPLSKAIIPQDRALPRSLRRALSEAALRLSEAVHTTSLSGQLLGAVTSLEILTAAQSDGFETTARRVRALVGNETADRYGSGAVFRQRHRYVHRGVPVNGPEVSLGAIGLALASLLRYAEIAAQFLNKRQLIDYLDLVGLAARTSRVQDREAEGILLSNLFEQGPAWEFPFWSKRFPAEDAT